MPEKPYESTTVPIDKSRGEINKLLAEQWRARGIMWEDDLDTGASVLRFRWTPAGSDAMVSVRLDLKPDPARVKSRNADERGRLRTREGRRIHRVAFWWLKSMAAAIDAGLLQREEVLLPWVEAPNGQTVAQAMMPRIVEFGSGKLALGKGRDA